MNEAIIKDIVSLKLKIIDAFTEKLPETVRDEVRKLQADIIKGINEAAREYLERESEEKCKSGTTKIEID